MATLLHHKHSQLPTSGLCPCSFSLLGAFFLLAMCLASSLVSFSNVFYTGDPPWTVLCGIADSAVIYPFILITLLHNFHHYLNLKYLFACYLSLLLFHWPHEKMDSWSAPQAWRSPSTWGGVTRVCSVGIWGWVGWSMARGDCRRTARSPSKAHQVPLSIEFPGKNTGMGICSFLQGILPPQGLNLGVLPHRQTVYYLSHHGTPIRM